MKTRRPIRIDSYSAGERMQILELCLFNLMKKGRTEFKIDHEFELVRTMAELLKKWDINFLAHWGRHNHISIPISQLLAHLQETGFVERRQGTWMPAAKGRTYIRQCSKRVRAAASKISNDVLDQIVEAIR